MGEGDEESVPSPPASPCLQPPPLPSPNAAQAHSTASEGLGLTIDTGDTEEEPVLEALGTIEAQQVVADFIESKDALRCFECRCELDPSDFYEADGAAFCERDYLRLFCSCTSCGQQLTSAYMTLGGAKYHPHCVVCVDCNAPLPLGEPIFSEEGSLLCSEHYYQKHGRECARCHERFVGGGSVNVFGRSYHPACFACTTCALPLDPEEYDGELDDDEVASKEHTYYFDEQERLQYCAEHFKQNFAFRCVVCDDYVLQGGVDAGEGNVCHTKCIACKICAKAFDEERDDNQFFFGEDVLCGDHYKDSMPVCPACGKTVTGEGLITDEGTFHSACLSCFACQEALDGEISQFNGQKYHSKCVVCCECHEPFKPGEGILTDAQGRLICKRDYTKQFASQCGACEEPITSGQRLQVKGVKYHADCFQCTTCKRGLIGQKFTLTADEKLSCFPCFAGVDFTKLRAGAD